MNKLFTMRARILSGFLIVFTVVFAVMYAAFNLVIKNYIESEAENKLESSVDLVRNNASLSVVMDVPSNKIYFSEIVSGIEGRRFRQVFTPKTEVMILSGGYELLFPNRFESMLKDVGLMESIATTLFEKSADLGSLSKYRADIGGATYYLSSVETMVRNEPLYVLFYVDMTPSFTLLRQINLALFLIICFAALITFLISAWMSARFTRPVRELRDFAAEIGDGKFSPRDFQGHDLEFSELFKSMNLAAGKLDSYDKEQKIFFQNASHELRTPLQSIKGYAEGLKLNVFDPPEPAIDVIMQESDRLSHLVDDLLYVSRMDNITSELTPARLDLREVIYACGERLRGMAISEHVAINFTLPDMPVNTFADEKLISRAFYNVISNGLRYAKTRVDIRCGVYEKSAIVQISDDGPGIDPAELPYIFNRFFKGKGGKHGIGLAIAKSAFEQYGGEITAENTGMGAMFTIRLKLA